MRRLLPLLGPGICAALLTAGCTPLKSGGVRDEPADTRSRLVARLPLLPSPPAGLAAPKTVPRAAATDPLPRASCVARRVARSEVLAEPAAFDPRASFFLEDDEDWRPATPFRSAEVTLGHGTNAPVSLPWPR